MLKTEQVLATVLLILMCTTGILAYNPTIELNGGWVFTGEKFEQRNLYISNGLFVKQKPGEIDRSIDVTGKYLIPPFGDAHTHNLDRKWQIPSVADTYLIEGTFYVQNLTAKTKGLSFFRTYFSKRETPDVRFAHQGLTSTLGHPFLAYEPYTMGIAWDKWKENMPKILKSRLDENNSYIFIDSKNDADEKLPGFFEAEPDIVKIYLTNVEDHAANSTDEKAGNSGLSPELAIHITKEAKKRGKTVYAHVDTTRDFEVAIEAGVDALAHIPVWDGKSKDKKRVEVSDDLMKKAIEKDIAVMPTMTIYTGRKKPGSVEYKNQMAAFGDFLARYKRLGGTILIGSDIFGRTLKPELEKFIELNIFSGAELLRLVTETTPKMIFPKRKIGKLESGYEGSVLALDGNPLSDSKSLFKVSKRIKQGIEIKMESKNAK